MGTRSVNVTANDFAKKAATIAQWIKMLRAAERWLREKEEKK